MTAQEDTRSLSRPGDKIDGGGWTAVLAVMAVAATSRSPAMGAFWNQDDWGLLARASGLISEPALPIRWLSQSAYWHLLWPLAGLDPAPYAATRLLLHALAAGGVVRLAWRLGLPPASQWLAGLIMAATPLAFSPLYWAAGVQDLLAVAAMVWALERWLAGGRLGRPAGALLALGALAAKETVVGLPLLMGALLVLGVGTRHAPQAAPARPARSSWLLVGVLTAAAIAAAGMALRFFATGPSDPYALGGPLVMLGHAMTYGLWLILPGPSYPSTPGLAPSLAGALVWLLWGGWSLHQWRRGRRVPAFALAGALLMLAPLLPLARHLAPDLAYPVEPFGCLALASLWPRRWRQRPLVLVAVALLAWSWGFFGMRARLSLRDADGVHADALVRRTAISAAASRHLRQLPAAAGGVVFVQPPLTRQTAYMAAELGEHWVTGSPLYHSLAGTLGPRLVLPGDRPITWANGLRFTPPGAFVLLDTGLQLQPWGTTRQALLHQTLTDLGLGFFERARLHLLRASLLAGPTFSYAYDPQLLPVPLEHAVQNLGAFLAFLERDHGDGASASDAAGLQTNILRLLSASTGRPVGDLISARPPIRQ